MPLDCIQPNPFQARTAQRPEHIERLADSILTDGLLEPPQARQSPDERGRYQLVFGHTRFAAYRLLRQRHPRDERFARMPLIAVALDDRRMFERGIAENLAREDISPIARARALKAYTERFGATQAESGKLFGLSQGGVSNLIRLLSLPPEVVEIVDCGGISERQARSLLDAPPAEALAIARAAVARHEDKRPSFIAERLRKLRAPRVAHTPAEVTLSPDACPGCWRVPRSYTRDREGWRCGDCGARVKVSVVRVEGRVDV